MKKKKLIYGVGSNDADYVIWDYEGGEHKLRQGRMCPYYKKGHSMLKRCYSEKYLQKCPTYRGCTVYKEWHLFSNFRKWCIDQEETFNIGIKNYQLDKDILFEDNKEYSPTSCAFVHKKVNMFVTERTASRGEWLIGCYWKKDRKKFQSQCCNSITGGRVYLGMFTTQEEAHLEGAKRKLEIAYEFSKSGYCNYDTRISTALIKKYKKVLTSAQERYNTMEESKL